MTLRAGSALLLIGLLATATARAQSAYDTDWACWYQGAGKLNCLLLKASTAATRQLEPTPSAGRPLPEAAQTIWLAGSDLYDQIVEIPLMNDPDDMAMVIQLAQAAVCGGAIDCRMTFVRDERELALLQSSVTGSP